jgi:hypothetical protein
MFLLVLAAGRRHAQQHNFRPIAALVGSGLCHHGRSVLQSCWRCYDEAALEGAVAIARAS